MITKILTSIFGEPDTQADNLLFFDPITPHRKKKLTVNMNTGKWRSWITEDLKGSSFYSLVKRFSSNEQYIRIAKNSSTLGTYNEYSKLKTIKDDSIKIPEDYKVLLNHHPYLKSRGISYLKSRLLNIHYNSIDNYLLFPSYDTNGDLTIYTKRYAGDNGDYNHILPKGYKSKSLGNEWLIDWDLPITLVEGPIDAAKVSNSILMYGKTMYSFILMKLKLNNVSYVNVYLDPDATKESSNIINKLLAEGFIVKEIQSKGDPGDHTIKENKEIINNTELIEDDLLFSMKDL